MNGCEPDTVIYWRTWIFKTQLSSAVPVCVCCFQVTRVDGEQLLKYQGDLERIVCVCVRLRCKQAYTLACSMLEHTLCSLSLIYPTEHCSTTGVWDSDLPILVKKTHKRVIVKKKKRKKEEESQNYFNFKIKIIYRVCMRFDPVKEHTKQNYCRFAIFSLITFI